MSLPPAFWFCLGPRGGEKPGKENPRRAWSLVSLTFLPKVKEWFDRLSFESLSKASSRRNSSTGLFLKSISRTMDRGRYKEEIEEERRWRKFGAKNAEDY